MAIHSVLGGDSVMRPRNSLMSPLDKPLFADGADGLALHNDQFENQDSTDGNNSSRVNGHNDADPVSRSRRSKMLKISKASRNPRMAEKLRKKGAPDPSRGA